MHRARAARPRGSDSLPSISARFIRYSCKRKQKYQNGNILKKKPKGSNVRDLLPSIGTVVDSKIEAGRYRVGSYCLFVQQYIGSMIAAKAPENAHRT